MVRSPINFRAFLIVAGVVSAAVFCAYIYMLDRIAGIASACVLFVAIIAIGCLLVYKYITKKIKLRVIAAIALSAALGISAFAFGASVCDEWKKGEAYNGYCSVSGRVCAADISSGNYEFVLEKLYLNGKHADGKMRVSVLSADNNAAEQVEIGDKLSFGARVGHIKLVNGLRVNGYAYRTDIRYKTSVRGDEVNVSFGKANVLEGFSSSLRDLLTENMGDKYGSIAFSMLTGDKYGLDDEVSDYFTAAGLGHIMAVSGLHIGFLALVLNFLLCKLGRKVRYPIVMSVLIGYAVLANFSPSVVRAVIMAAISGFAVFVGGRRDLLSSLLCAFSFILAFKPLYLFDAGFLLSFCAIFGIALFSNSIKLFLTKRGAHNKIANGIGASVAVSLGITPVQTYFFGRIHLLSVVANVLLLPFVSVIFIVILATLPIAAIPHCGVVLYAGKYMLAAMDYAVQGIAAVPYVTFAIRTSAVVFACYPVMFCASGYFIMDKGKTVAVVYSAAVCISIFAISAV